MGSYTYRWVHNNSITLPGETSMLTVNILTESDVGVYRCEVTNSAGLTGSNTATIELGGEWLGQILTHKHFSKQTESTHLSNYAVRIHDDSNG